MKKTLLLCVVFAVALSSVTLAGNNPNAKVAVHVKVHNPKQNCTTTLPVIATCQDIVTTYPGFSFDGFPVFFDLVEYLFGNMSLLTRIVYTLVGLSAVGIGLWLPATICGCTWCSPKAPSSIG